METFFNHYKTFIRYAVVGVVGTGLDLASLYLFVEYLSLPILSASVLSFVLAVTNNFILNKAWTFENKSKNYRKLYIKFLIVSAVGLTLTIASMTILVGFFSLWYMFAKGLTSLIVLIWNFLANKLWTFRIRERHLNIPDRFPYDLSIIVPAYNEENRIKNTLLIIHEYLEEKNIHAEIIVSDDGSKDATREIVEKFKERVPGLKLIGLRKNEGKGSAVRRGVEESLGNYILFADADNSTPIEELGKLIHHMKMSEVQIAIGSRYMGMSQVKIKQPRYRILLGRVGNFLIRLFLLDDIKDTQCGFKLFEHRVAKEIFSFQKVKRFGFDMEALVVAKSLGYRVVEVPVSWFNSPESRLRPIKDSLITLKDLVYIKLNLWSGRYHHDDL